MTVLRLPGDVVERRENRIGKGYRSSAHLVVTLIVGKEEKLVLFDWSAKRPAVLSAHKEWVKSPLAPFRIGVDTKDVSRHTRRIALGRALKVRERRHIVIAEEEESASMKGIGPGSRDYVYSPRRNGSAGKVESVGADLKLLHSFAGEVL